jgi:hypothetical protein
MLIIIITTKTAMSSRHLYPSVVGALCSILCVVPGDFNIEGLGSKSKAVENFLPLVLYFTISRSYMTTAVEAPVPTLKA